MEQSKVDKQFNEIVNGQDRPVLTERMKRIYDAAADFELYEVIVEKYRAEVMADIALSAVDKNTSVDELRRAHLDLGKILDSLMHKYDITLDDAIKASEICYTEFVRRGDEEY